MKTKTRKVFLGCCLVSVFTLLGSRAGATFISFVPDANSIQAGNSIDVDLVIADLAGAYVGAFDLNIIYDDTVLAFDSYSLTANLGDISQFEAGDWSMGHIGFGAINIAELSYLWDLSFQNDSFTLATLSFTGSLAGTSDLCFAGVFISDDWGGAIAVEQNRCSIEVPEPATMLLLGTGLIGLAGIGMRRRKK